MDILTENSHNDNKGYKIVFLAAASLISLTVTWLLIDIALYDGRPLTFWIWVAGAGLLWTGFFTFFVLTNNHRGLFTGLNLAGLVSYLAILPQSISVWLGGVLFFFLLYLFLTRLKSLEKNQSHFSVRHLVGGSIIIPIYAFLVMLGFNIYHNTAQDFYADPGQFYERMSQSVTRSFRYTERISPDEFDLSQSLDEFLIRHVPEEHQSDFDLVQTREEFLRRFGVKAAGEEPLSEVFARVAAERVREAVGDYERIFPLIFTLIIVALLRTFAFVFYWLAILTTWLMFKLLLAAGFFRISKVQIEVDKLEI